MHIHQPNHTIHRFKYLLSSASNDYDNFKHIRSNRKTLLKKSKLKKFHPMNWMNWLVMCIHQKNLFRITPNQIGCFFFLWKKKPNFSFKYLPKHTWKVINSKQIKSTFLIYLFFITRGVYLFVFSLKSNYFSKCSILLRVCECVFLKADFQ